MVPTPALRWVAVAAMLELILSKRLLTLGLVRSRGWDRAAERNQFSKSLGEQDNCGTDMRTGRSSRNRTRGGGELGLLVRPRLKSSSHSCRSTWQLLPRGSSQRVPKKKRDVAGGREASDRSVRAQPAVA